MPHGGTGRFDVETVRHYARAARARGVTDIAVTEHLFRFPDVQDAMGEWWAHDPDPRQRDHMTAYMGTERLEQTLAEYVDIVLEAGSTDDGAARVRLGLEVDLFSGHMDRVAELLVPHPWDVLLGSVHWLGAWGFDQWGEPVVDREWARRDATETWHAYVEAVEEMAASGLCDVLAHPDLVGGGGPARRVAPDEARERLVKAAAANELCVEVSSRGWRHPGNGPYPLPALLAEFQAAGVGLSLASDAHAPDQVAERHRELVGTALAAGYAEVMLFERRRPRGVPLVEGVD